MEIKGTLRGMANAYGKFSLVKAYHVFEGLAKCQPSGHNK